MMRADSMLSPSDFDAMEARGLDPKKPADRLAFRGRESSVITLDDCPALDLVAFADREPKPPTFFVDPIIPRGAPALLSGHGGAGKSHLALQLAVCVASGSPFLGMPVSRDLALYYSCEDNANVLHWRLRRICASLGVDLRELDGWLTVFDMSSRDAVLFAENAREPGANLTARYGWLAEQCGRHKTGLLIVDNASDAFDGNENARSKVRQFVRAVQRLVTDNEGAALILSHIDKSSAKFRSNADAESYSGSTAWHNSVRSRLFLSADEASGTVTLSHPKLNWGARGDAIMLRWVDGHLQQAQADVTRDTTGSGHIVALLNLIDDFEKRGEFIAASHTSPTANAYRMLHGEPRYPKGLKRDELFTLLREMQRRNLIEAVEYRDKNRKTKERIRVTEQGRKLC